MPPSHCEPRLSQPSANRWEYSQVDWGATGLVSPPRESRPTRWAASEDGGTYSARSPYPEAARRCWTLEDERRSSDRSAHLSGVSCLLLWAYQNPRRRQRYGVPSRWKLAEIADGGGVTPRGVCHGLSGIAGAGALAWQNAVVPAQRKRLRIVMRIAPSNPGKRLWLA